MNKAQKKPMSLKSLLSDAEVHPKQDRLLSMSARLLYCNDLDLLEQDSSLRMKK
jgi:hypothetical protein